MAAAAVTIERKLVTGVDADELQTVHDGGLVPENPYSVVA
jgi:hypothetical protein